MRDRLLDYMSRQGWTPLPFQRRTWAAMRRGWCYRHDPVTAGPFVAGHIHPVMRLRDPHGGSLRCPVFHLRRDGIVLPAFGTFTGGSEVTLTEKEGAILISGPDRLLPVNRP